MFSKDRLSSWLCEQTLFSFFPELLEKFSISGDSKKETNFIGLINWLTLVLIFQYGKQLPFWWKSDQGSQLEQTDIVNQRPTHIESKIFKSKVAFEFQFGPKFWNN